VSSVWRLLSVTFVWLNLVKIVKAFTWAENDSCNATAIAAALADRTTAADAGHRH
jgi:hypothetical protein